MSTFFDYINHLLTFKYLICITRVVCEIFYHVVLTVAILILLTRCYVS
jgi:hypothetical protein